MNHDESEALEQQKKSDIFSIGVPEISVNLLSSTTARSPSILNKLMAKSSGEKIATTTPKQYLHLTEIFSLLNSKFPQLKRADATDDNEISETSADMIEIEVPLVGNEFARNFNVDVERINNEVNVHKESDEDVNEAVPEGYVEISIMPATTTEAQSTETTNFQTPFGDTTTFESYFETSPSTSYTKEVSSYKSLNNDMEGIESRLMDQWSHLHNVGDDFGKKNYQTEYFTRSKPPMSVKIILDPKESRCKNNPKCRQVSFAKSNIDHQHSTDSDEDLFFETEPHVYFEKRNQLKSRRAADDGFFKFPLLKSIDSSQVNFPQPAPAPMPMPAPRMAQQTLAFRKPEWIEKLERESSMERSERVNKNLGNMMKAVAIWAHFDKFLTDRARSMIKRVAFDDDYEPIVGSAHQRTHENIKLKEVSPKSNEPFT